MQNKSWSVPLSCDKFLQFNRPPTHFMDMLLSFSFYSVNMASELLNAILDDNAVVLDEEHDNNGEAMLDNSAVVLDDEHDNNGQDEEAASEASDEFDIVNAHKPLQQSEPKKKKVFNKRKPGPRTAKELARRESQNRSQRRARRSKTLLGRVMVLDDAKTANCDVFCLISNRDTGKSMFCGSAVYAEKFKIDEKLCSFKDYSHKFTETHQAPSSDPASIVSMLTTKQSLTAQRGMTCALTRDRCSITCI